MPTESKFEIFKFPFSADDIFSHLIPGSFFIIVAYFFDNEIFKLDKNSVLPVFQILGEHSKINENYLGAAVFLTVLIIIVYVFGHIITILSHQLIDKSLAISGPLQPFQYFDQTGLNYLVNGRRNRVLRGMFFWINALIFTSYLSWAFSYEINSEVLLYLVGWVFIFCGLTILFYGLVKLERKLSVCAKSTESAKCLFAKIKQKISQKNFKGMIKYLCLLILYGVIHLYDIILSFVWAGLYDLVLKNFINIDMNCPPYNEALLNKYNNHFKATFRYETKDAGDNNFWFTSMYIQERSKNLSQILQNNLSRFTFVRNLSGSFFLLFLYMFFIFVINGEISKSILSSKLVYIPIFAYSLSILILERYHHLYVNYYTYLVFRSFVFLKEMETRNNSVIIESK
jgi:hypothetical protein